MLSQPTQKWPKKGRFASCWTISFVLLSSFMAYGYSYAQANIFNQVPVIEALIDSNLFTHDFYIQEMTGFTPRFYYYRLVIALHQLGLSLPIAQFALFLLAFGSMILGLWSIGRYLANSAFAGVALAFLGLAALKGTLGITDIFRVEPISAIYAMGITVWGIYFCCRRRWRLGYLLFGLATLLQFLIGFLPACLWAPSLLLGTVIRRRFGQSASQPSFPPSWKSVGQFIGACLLFSGCVALVYVPMVMAGNTSSEALSDATFVHLYGYIRHPHHIILSSFPTKEWREFALLMASGFVMLQLSDKLEPTHKRDLALTLVMTCVLLLVGYVFVEQIALALVAKLQFARATPFAMITVWITLSVVSSEYHQRKNYPVSLLLLAMPLVDNIGPALLLAFVVVLLVARLAAAKQMPPQLSGQSSLQSALKPLIRLNSLSLHRQRAVTLTYSLFFIVILACWSFFPVLFASLAYPLLQQPFPTFFRRSRPYRKVATLGLVLYLCLHLSGGIASLAEGKALTPLHRKIRLYAPPKDSLAQVALQFKAVSPPDALVLVPPSDEAFRFYAERSVVVTFKSFPFTDKGIVIWQSRLEEILGPLSPQMMSADYTYELYRQRSGEELMALAKSYGASYLLTQVGWHPDVTGEVVAREGEWEILHLCHRCSASVSQR